MKENKKSKNMDFVDFDSFLPISSPCTEPYLTFKSMRNTTHKGLLGVMWLNRPGFPFVFESTNCCTTQLSSLQIEIFMQTIFNSVPPKKHKLELYC